MFYTDFIFDEIFWFPMVPYALFLHFKLKKKNVVKHDEEN